MSLRNDRLWGLLWVPHIKIPRDYRRFSKKEATAESVDLTGCSYPKTVLIAAITRPSLRFRLLKCENRRGNFVYVSRRAPFLTWLVCLHQFHPWVLITNEKLADALPQSLCVRRPVFLDSPIPLFIPRPPQYTCSRSPRSAALLKRRDPPSRSRQFVETPRGDGL